VLEDIMPIFHQAIIEGVQSFTNFTGSSMEDSAVVICGFLGVNGAPKDLVKFLDLDRFPL
jgi:hypothetical protein